MRRTCMALIPIAILFMFSSCAPIWQQPGPAPSLEKRVMSPVDHTLIEERINRIKQALERRDLTASERTVLYSLLEAYQAMENLPGPSREREYYRDTIRRLFHVLSSSEDLYLSLRPQVGTKEGSAISVFERKTSEILNSYLSGNYKSVIDQCIQLKETFGPDALTPEVGLLFALSLARQGMVKDAIAIGEQIANRLQARPDVVVLRAQLARWNLQMGDREAAIRNYEKLADLLDERQRLKTEIGLALGPIPTGETKEVAASPPHVSQPPEAFTVGVTEASATLSLDEFLAKIKALVDEKKFEHARDLIKKRRHQTTSREELERLSEAIKEVDKQEDLFLQERISVLSEQSQVLRQAEKLIEKEKYDQALSKLDLISGELAHNMEVSRLKQAAISGIINRDRNRAARLFLAAKQTTDPVKKERYLRACLEILKTLVEEYPSSPLISKIKDHIQKVTEELERLG